MDSDRCLQEGGSAHMNRRQRGSAGIPDAAGANENGKQSHYYQPTNEFFMHGSSFRARGDVCASLSYGRNTICNYSAKVHAFSSVLFMASIIPNLMRLALHEVKIDSWLLLHYL